MKNRGKKYGLGGDIGKFMLNNLEASALGQFGLDLYKPKFDTSIMQGTNDIAQKVIGGTQKAALGIASTQIPGLSTAVGAVQGIGKNIQFKKGGRMYGTGGTMPINPGDLDKVTGNTLQYDGNAHSNGGIPLQNGAELEKNETVIKPGAIGNENPYALSPNIVITEEAAKMFGLSKSDIGKSIADVSRTVEARKPKSQEKMAVKTNEMNKKFALDKLMKANEYLASQMEDMGEKKPYGGELPYSLYSNQLNLQTGKEPFNYNVGLVTPQVNVSPYLGYNNVQKYPGQRFLNPQYSNPVTNNQVLPVVSENESSYKPASEYSKPIEDNSMNQRNLYAGNEFLSGLFPNRTVDNQVLNTNQQPFNPTWNGSSNQTINTPNGNISVPSPLTTAGKENTPLSSFNLGLGLKGAALLGELATIGGKPKNIPAQYNPYKSQIIDNANLKIDNSAIKNDIASSLNTALNSSSGRSWASQRALNAQMMGNASDAQSKANLQSQETNNRYKEQLSQTYNNLGQQDVAARNQAEVLNAQTQAAWKQGIRAGIGNIGNGGADALIKHQYVQDARKDGANLNMMQAKLLVDKWSGTFGGIDNELIKLVMQAYPDQFKTEEEAKQYFSKITKK